MLRTTMISFLMIFVIGCSDGSNRLIKELDSDNPDVRKRAATVLTMKYRFDNKVVKKLIKQLNSNKERLVFISVQVLGTLSDTTAVEPLGKLIDNPNPNIRESAAFSLGSIGHESAFPFLKKALDDSVSGVRHSAIKSLANIQYPQSAKLAMKMLRDESDSVRAAAVNTMFAYRTFKEADVHAADFIVPLTDKSDLVRYVAVQALGYAYPDSELSCGLLLDCLKDPNKNVRVEVIISLNRLKCKEAVPFLKKMYDNATVDEERAITEALKNITGETYPAIAAKKN